MIKFNGHTFKTGNRHGLPSFEPLQEKFRRVHFHGTIGEGVLQMGTAGHDIRIDCCFCDLSFTTARALAQYLKNELEPKKNTVGKLEVRTRDNDLFTDSFVHFYNWEPIVQEGHRYATALPDVIQYSGEALNDRVGPGSYWMEAILIFRSL